MKERAYRYLYWLLTGVLVLSGALYLGMHGVVPFDVRVSWTDQGIGSALVVSRQVPTANVNQRVAYVTQGLEGVAVGVVLEAARRDGELQYRMSNAPVGTWVRGRELVGSVLGTLPFMGVWVRALENPLGQMALLGIPTIMLMLDLMLFMLVRAVVFMRVVRGRRRSVSARERGTEVLQSERLERPAEVSRGMDRVQMEEEHVVLRESRVADVVVEGMRIHVPPRAKKIRVQDSSNSSTDIIHEIGSMITQQHHYGY
jgi:hypothetical protein